MSDIFDPFNEFGDLKSASYSYLVNEIKRQSRILVINEVYKQVLNNEKSMKNGVDPYFKNIDEKISILKKMIKWFEEQEDYEKCKELKKICNKYANY